MIRRGNDARGAEFSDDETLRYCLWRVWFKDLPTLGFCMLNPSTANETNNDPTVERCQRRAAALGYGGLFVVNLFAFRATDPSELYRQYKATGDPIGLHNDRVINGAALRVDKLVCGWGVHGLLDGRADHVVSMLRRDHPGKAHHLGLNKNGSPKHPLYVPYNVQPMIWDR